MSRSDCVIETPRLQLRELTSDDAGFMLELLNGPSFLRYIGDKGVRNLDDARIHIATGPMISYAKHGFGLYKIALKGTNTLVGICGLLQRDTMDDPDLGYAMLAEYFSKGYATEAAAAVLEHARSVLGLKRIIALTSSDNAASIALLLKLGFRFEGIVEFGGESNLYAISF